MLVLQRFAGAEPGASSAFRWEESRLSASSNLSCRSYVSLMVTAVRGRDFHCHGIVLVTERCVVVVNTLAEILQR